MASPTLTAQAVIRRRLLVNALVDPDEAAVRLPAGLRPHITEQGTVVGRCLLELVHLRPTGLPAGVGVTVRAAASRIACEWEDDGGQGDTVVGVYVPARFTESRLALALGGRWFPGVHQRGEVRIHDSATMSIWRVDAPDNDLRVTVSAMPGADATTSVSDPVGLTCVGASVGLSPDRHGRLEAVRMDPHHRFARPVEVDDLSCEFLATFATARPAPTFLMQDVPVTWSPAEPPMPAQRAA
jgi:hypothetical protein